MRISSTNVEMTNRSITEASDVPNRSSNEVVTKGIKEVKIQNVQTPNKLETIKNQEENKETISKEHLEKAVNTMNDFLEMQHKASKFVFHEGLDKYYVKLVDSQTEEVIKEIPPERLLDAFYEMQKLTGMIVDEKI